jgi:acyl carrier protein
MKLEATLETIFIDVLRLEPQNIITAELNLTDGWDSFAHMQLMVAIDENIGLVNISPEVFASLNSYKKIFEYLNNATF